MLMAPDNAMRDTELYIGLRQFCVDAINYLSRYIDGLRRQFYDADQLASNCWILIRTTEFYTTADQLLRTDSTSAQCVGKIVGGRGVSRLMLTTEKILRSILMEQLENPLQGPGAINFDQSAFDDPYIRLQQFSRSDTIRYPSFP